MYVSFPFSQGSGNMLMRMGLGGGGAKETKQAWEQEKYSSLEEHTLVGYSIRNAHSSQYTCK